MAQFSVHKNINPNTKNTYPYLLDLQHNILAEINTRVVAPLISAKQLKNNSVKTLTPSVEIEGKAYIVLMPQLAGIAQKDLGAVAVDLSNIRSEIIAAIDLLVSGI